MVPIKGRRFGGQCHPSSLSPRGLQSSFPPPSMLTPSTGKEAPPASAPSPITHPPCGQARSSAQEPLSRESGETQMGPFLGSAWGGSNKVKPGATRWGPRTGTDNPAHKGHQPVSFTECYPSPKTGRKKVAAASLEATHLKGSLRDLSTGIATGTLPSKDEALSGPHSLPSATVLLTSTALFLRSLGPGRHLPPAPIL